MILTKGQPTKVVITQRAAQRMVQWLGQSAAQQLQIEAQRERDTKRSEYLQDLARPLLERGAKWPEVQCLLRHSRLSITGVSLTPSEDDTGLAIGRVGISY